MRFLVFASRNRKELLRDPLNLAFGIGFPLVLLLLLSAIQANIPVSLFKIEKLAPGIAVFGLSFISLFSGTLIAKDRTTSFLMRLFASPLSASDFILGYALPLFLISYAVVRFAALCVRFHPWIRAAALANGNHARCHMLHRILLPWIVAQC